MNYKSLSSAKAVGANLSRNKIIQIVISAVLAGSSVHLILSDNFRLQVLAGIGFILVAILILRRLYPAVVSLLIFLPFMNFVRRFVYLFAQPANPDPILIIPDIIVLLMCLNLLMTKTFSTEEIKRSTFFKCLIIFLGLLLLQTFNPMRGSLFTGLTGAKFYLVPALWVFFGALSTRNEILKLFKLIMVIGIVTACYGAYQALFGFFSFEETWMKYAKLQFYMGEDRRAFSTFAGAEELAGYMGLLGSICFAMLLRNKARLLAGLGLLASMLGLYSAGSRSYIFGLIFSMVIMGLAVSIKNYRRFISFLCSTSLLMVVLHAWLLPNVADMQLLNKPTLTKYVISGVLNPTKQQTFMARLDIWSEIVLQAAKFPIGYGLAAVSIGKKFVEQSGELGFVGTESYLFAILYSCGVVGLIVFVVLWALALKYVIKLVFIYGDREKISILGVLIASSLNILFGTVLTLYSVGPIIWLLIGFVYKETDKYKNVTAAFKSKI